MRGGTNLSTSNDLAEPEQEYGVEVNLVVAIRFTNGLDTLQGGSDLDENALLGDANRPVKLDEMK